MNEMDHAKFHLHQRRLRPQKLFSQKEFEETQVLLMNKSVKRANIDKANNSVCEGEYKVYPTFSNQHLNILEVYEVHKT